MECAILGYGGFFAFIGYIVWIWLQENTTSKDRETPTTPAKPNGEAGSSAWPFVLIAGGIGVAIALGLASVGSKMSNRSSSYPKSGGAVNNLYDTGNHGGAVRVRAYRRSDGTYVRGHYRSRPDGDRRNNWSTYPNVNPYTGKQGSRRN